MSDTMLRIERSGPLSGSVEVAGAKNAVLVIIASLLLPRGKSVLTNVPCSDDVGQMIQLLTALGAEVSFNKETHVLTADTSMVSRYGVSADIMKKMRASILVMGPLLALFRRAEIALPGGCVIGTRPIDLHLKNFKKMGALITMDGDSVIASAQALHSTTLVLDYPSVGATENILMAAVLTPGKTRVVNAALEPEVMDLVAILKKMGARITVEAPATIMVEGVTELQAVQHEIMPDRLEAGSLLLAAAITGGDVQVINAHANDMDVFLLKLEEMGHTIIVGEGGKGIRLIATQNPKAVSFKTSPYPGFPTDLQAPTMAALCLAEGVSVVEELVFENRLVHIRELQKMGAQISVEGNKATITGVDALFGANVIASDIRASCALVLAGLVAKGVTHMSGIHHWKRGYDALEAKLRMLGGHVEYVEPSCALPQDLTALQSAK